MGLRRRSKPVARDKVYQTAGYLVNAMFAVACGGHIAVLQML